jgi:Zn-dependent protease
MKWQWKLGRFAGIDVYVHATFLLLIGWVGYDYWSKFQDWSRVLIGILFILALFVCVVLHEYGHALTARKYGIKTRDITLYPIGGVARLERMPDRPIEELWVALAGPAVNIVIAGILFLYLALTNNSRHEPRRSSLGAIVDGDVFLAVFNLFPPFPWTAAASCAPCLP